MCLQIAKICLRFESGIFNSLLWSGNKNFPFLRQAVSLFFGNHSGYTQKCIGKWWTKI